MDIASAIIECTRDLQKVHDRVFPWMVADWVDLYDVTCSVRTARRWMARMAEQEKLTRLGPRKGYLLN